jgi:hypothetical protein
MPVAVPSAAPPLAGDPAPDAPVPGEPATGGDLDQFFEALRQVVRDARERLPLVEDHLVGADDTVAGPVVDPSRSTGADVVPSHLDPVIASAPASSTELAPTTAELVASLEADRDLWRERAVVWRERALGADQLVKALNSHLSDLNVNLDDLRLAIRVLSGETSETPEPRGELPAGARLNSVDRYVEPGA